MMCWILPARMLLSKNTCYKFKTYSIRSAIIEKDFLDLTTCGDVIFQSMETSDLWAFHKDLGPGDVELGVPMSLLRRLG